MSGSYKVWSYRRLVTRRHQEEQVSDADLHNDDDAGSPDGAGGDDDKDWVAGLSLDDATRESIRKTTFGTAEDLAKGYLSLQARLGKTVQIPGDNATDEERLEFRKKLGMPDQAEGYELPKPELPAGVTIDETFANAFRTAALKEGLSKEQARGLYNWYNQLTSEQVVQSQNEAKTAFGKTIATMQSEWGDNYDVEYALTMRAVDKFGGSELKIYFNESGLGHDPVIIKAFTQVAHAVGEDNLVGGEEDDGGAPAREPGVLTYPSMKDVKPLPG